MYWILRQSMTSIQEQMNQRIAAGEFGNPVNIPQMNAAWAEYLEEEIAKQGRKAIYNNISGLWAQNQGKVAFSGRTKEDITIPSGSKILCFNRVAEANERAPDLGLVWVSYED